ncbi:hypothetical protein [Gemmatimonas sp.]|uniref:hypothetical protein n=1 Tax=Gemmatimonas sp. TaxID=1962908 RepID=UPI00286E0B8C|nr:hypothetical protein [Gemmatimonas sp.]
MSHNDGIPEPLISITVFANLDQPTIRDSPNRRPVTDRDINPGMMIYALVASLTVCLAYERRYRGREPRDWQSISYRGSHRICRFGRSTAGGKNEHKD